VVLSSSGNKKTAPSSFQRLVHNEDWQDSNVSRVEVIVYIVFEIHRDGEWRR
jgi:hypothetical protein